MFSKLSLSLAAGVFLPILLPVLALAEPGPLQGACMSDVKAMCGSIQPGGGRIRDCMKDHRAQLSVACKSAIADRMLERGRSPSAGSSAAIRTVPKTDD
jgi:Cysteine rich repeat